LIPHRSTESSTYWHNYSAGQSIRNTYKNHEKHWN